MAKPMKCKSFFPLLMNCSECETDLNVPVLEMRTDFHFKTRSDFTRASHVRPHFVYRLGHYAPLKTIKNEII